MDELDTIQLQVSLSHLGSPRRWTWRLRTLSPLHRIVSRTIGFSRTRKAAIRSAITKLKKY